MIVTSLRYTHTYVQTRTYYPHLPEAEKKRSSIIIVLSINDRDGHGTAVIFLFRSPAVFTLERAGSHHLSLPSANATERRLPT